MGCVGFDTVNVVINELPVVVTSSDDVICIGDSQFISAISTSPNYTWDNGLGSGQQQKISPSIATDYIVSTVDANNCVGLDTVRITVNALPVLSLNADTNLCFGESLVLAVSGADTYNWDNGLGAGSTHTISPSTGSTYIVEATDTNACVNTDSVTVLVTVVNVTASADTNVCAGDAVFLAATGAVSYNWDNGLGAGQFQDTIPTMDTTYVVAGTDGMGCVGMDTVHVVINELPVVVTSSDDTICRGDSLFISALSTSPNYSWDNGLGSGQQQQVAPSISTAYIVSTLDVNNCIGLDTVSISINALPVLSLNTDTAICFGDSIVLVVNGADTYSWNNGLGEGSTHTTSPSTGSTYIVEAKDTNACVNTDSVTVMITVVDVIASNDVTVCLGASTVISASGANVLAWNNNLGSGDEFEITPTVSANYIVVGIENGCIAADTLMVTVDNLCFNVPNVFTPNGDGKNEVWNIAGLEQYPEAIVKVFNRGGDVVFESVRGYTESWDGTFNGVTSAATTYYYVIDLGDAGGNSSSGTINIIR
jgi:gliding motility-associated-like protein